LRKRNRLLPNFKDHLEVEIDLGAFVFPPLLGFFTFLWYLCSILFPYGDKSWLVIKKWIILNKSDVREFAVAVSLRIPPGT